MGDGRRYRIDGVLGKGGFGTVYRAQLLGEGGFTRKVALKVLNADMAGMEDVARRLRDEARLLGLLRHRAILHVDGLVRLNDRWTVVMEYIEGADLHKVARVGGMPLGPALEVVGEVAAALHVAYSTPAPSGEPLRLLHRDIKPPNILLTSAGEVKVLDFGIARAEFGNREAKTKSIMYGSVGYMAPERLDFEELPEGDVYALGTVLYEILIGTPLGKASIRAERHEKKIAEAVDLVSRKVGPMPPDVAPLLSSMLSYDPEERPSAREVERRCRTIRQQIQGPWLRDWAEKAIPPLVSQSDDLAADDFSGSVVAESGGVSLLVDGGGGRGAISSTMPVHELSPPPIQSGNVSKSGRQRRASGGGAGAIVTGFGLLSCLTVAGIGLFVVIFIGVVAVSMPSGSDTSYIGSLDDDVDTGRGTPAVDPDPDPQPGAAGLEAFGPPSMHHMTAKLQPPWSQYSLPIAPGHVTYSDDRTLLVQYSGRQLGVLAQIWRESIESEMGFKTRQEFSTEETITLMFDKGSQKMALAATPTMGDIVVSIAIVE